MLLANPDTGATIDVPEGSRLHTLLTARENPWTPTDQPSATGAPRPPTQAELAQVQASLDQAVAASVADRADLRQIVEPLAVQLPEVASEVDQLTLTVEATTTLLAPKPTPRTDALEQWRQTAQAAIDELRATVTAIDLPAAINAWVTANPPPAPTWAQITGKPTFHAVATSGSYSDLGDRPTLGTMAAQGKSTVDITGGSITGITDLAVGDGGTGASTPANARTNLGLKGAAILDVGTLAGTVAAGNDPRLSDARTPTAHTHPAAEVTGLATVASSGAYGDLSGRPALATVATTGNYNDLTNKPAGGGPAVVKLTADHAAFTAVALANVTGLAHALTAGTLYRFRFWVIFRTAALTTGARFGLTYPAATVQASLVRILFAVDGSDAFFEGALTTSGDSVVSTAVPAINTDYLALVEGAILPSASGSLQLQAATEVANSALTVRNGSHAELWTV